MIMFAFPVGKLEPAIPTVKVPGAYPYEETCARSGTAARFGLIALAVACSFSLSRIVALALGFSGSRFTNSKYPPAAHGESRARGSIQIQRSAGFL